jgi:hypothetical protein
MKIRYQKSRGFRPLLKVEVVSKVWHLIPDLNTLPNKPLEKDVAIAPL